MGGGTAVGGPAVSLYLLDTSRYFEVEMAINQDVLHRIIDIENKIGGGLIEEIIQVAEGELKLAHTMLQARVYVSPPLILLFLSICITIYTDVF